MDRPRFSIARGMAVVAVLAANFAAFRAVDAADLHGETLLTGAPMALAVQLAAWAAARAGEGRRVFWTAAAAAGLVWPVGALAALRGGAAAQGTWLDHYMEHAIRLLRSALGPTLTRMIEGGAWLWPTYAASLFAAQLVPTVAVGLLCASVWSLARRPPGGADAG